MHDVVCLAEITADHVRQSSHRRSLRRKEGLNDITILTGHDRNTPHAHTHQRRMTGPECCIQVRGNYDFVRQPSPGLLWGHFATSMRHDSGETSWWRSYVAAISSCWLLKRFMQCLVPALDCVVLGRPVICTARVRPCPFSAIAQSCATADSSRPECCRSHRTLPACYLDGELTWLIPVGCRRLGCRNACLAGGRGESSAW
ncbi:MAG: hypothetical protein JWM34_1075 [Ilumatobacteraceae bacterium]|nr:hypothetical protein [Ilumatobacteraceae bacterium]